MSAYIDQHRDRFGVEPICSVLQFAPPTYYAIKAKPPSVRALRDAELKPEIVRVSRDNFGVYGVDKVRVASARQPNQPHSSQPSAYR